MKLPKSMSMCENNSTNNLMDPAGAGASNLRTTVANGARARSRQARELRQANLQA